MLCTPVQIAAALITSNESNTKAITTATDRARAIPQFMNQLEFHRRVFGACKR
jgi:hypothetical protein